MGGGGEGARGDRRRRTGRHDAGDSPSGTGAEDTGREFTHLRAGGERLSGGRERTRGASSRTGGVFAEAVHAGDACKSRAEDAWPGKRNRLSWEKRSRPSHGSGSGAFL